MSDGVDGDLVDRVVQVLQVLEVGGEEVLDRAGVDVLDVAEPHDDTRQDDDREVRRVSAHPLVALRQDLVGRGGQPHDALTCAVAPPCRCSRAEG